MQIQQVACPSCGNSFRIKYAVRPKAILCPKCKHQITASVQTPSGKQSSSFGPTETLEGPTTIEILSKQREELQAAMAKITPAAEAQSRKDLVAFGVAVVLFFVFGGLVKLTGNFLFGILASSMVAVPFLVFNSQKSRALGEAEARGRRSLYEVEDRLHDLGGLSPDDSAAVQRRRKTWHYRAVMKAQPQ